MDEIIIDAVRKNRGVHRINIGAGRPVGVVFGHQLRSRVINPDLHPARLTKNVEEIHGGPGDGIGIGIGFDRPAVAGGKRRGGGW